MISAAGVIEHTREKTRIMVAVEKLRTGSQMKAYGIIGDLIDSSPGWVRKFIGRSPEVKPDLETGLSILIAFQQNYNDICALIEDKADKLSAQSAELEQQFNAANPGLEEILERVAQIAPAAEAKVSNPESAAGVLVDRALLNGGAQ
jgi:hypothetical protein